MESASGSTIRVQLLPARRHSWRGRYGFRVGEAEVWPEVEERPFRITGSFEWPDGCRWRIEYGDESAEPTLWNGESIVMRRSTYALAGLTPTAAWEPADGSSLPGFDVRDKIRLRGRTVSYSRAERKFASFRWRWWWQDMFLECDRGFESLLPVLCADLITQIHFKSPG